MSRLQNLCEQEIRKLLPKLLLEKAIIKKMDALGIPITKKTSNKIVNHILTNQNKTLKLKEIKQETLVTLEFSAADLLEVKNEFNTFLEEKLPKVIEDTSDKFSTTLLKTLKSSWVKEHSYQQIDCLEFRERLEIKWGDALNKLRILLTTCREWLQEIHKQHAHSKKYRGIKLKDILIRLNTRALQVTAEIICLLENGFADGAMARWRTLHEIDVVAQIISQYGESITERYITHQAIESKRAMDKYMSYAEQLGYLPLSERDKKKIIKAYDAAIIKYGKLFKSDYGWAAKHLGIPRPTLADLESAAGRAKMRSHYQMASDNVHAGIKSIFFRLGAGKNYTGLLGGCSDVGLDEPGQITAHTLTQISLLVGLSEPTLDDLLIAKVIQKLEGEIIRAFYKANRKLQKKYKNIKN